MKTKTKPRKKVEIHIELIPYVLGIHCDPSLMLDEHISMNS